MVSIEYHLLHGATVLDTEDSMRRKIQFSPIYTAYKIERKMLDNNKTPPKLYNFKLQSAISTLKEKHRMFQEE